MSGMLLKRAARESVTVSCRTTLEPETKGKISDTDPAFIQFWHFAHCGFFGSKFDFKLYQNVIYLRY